MALTVAINPFNVACPVDGVIGYAVFVGAGAAAPTVPADAAFPTECNLAARATPTIVRNGVGDCTYTLAVTATPARVFSVVPTADGTTDLDATVRSIAVTSGALVVRVLTKTAAGVATDLTTADLLRLVIFGSNSTG